MFSETVDLLVVLIAGLVTAAVIFSAVYLGNIFFKPKVSLPSRYAESPWMRFSGQSCISASRTALEIVQSDDAQSIVWEQARDALKVRFAELPRILPDPFDETAQESYASRFPDDSGMLHIDGDGEALTITITNEAPLSPVDKHRELSHRAELEIRENAIDKLTHPMWAMSKGQVIWSNKAFRTLQRAKASTGSEIKEVFHFDTLRALSGQSQRVSISVGSSQSEAHWFDISSVEVSEDVLLNCAVNVDGLIAAETAQRKFVQTLAKTFAQLSTGLAIFDRDRRLVLFNPALIDLTSLAPHFLSAQPNLQSFFDRLRDNRIMPEPKDYSSWRRQIADLVVKSSDGRYQETWRLPNGLTYRIVGRPHPDGAIAILIEDISVEVSLTQRFKGQLELRNIAMEAMDDALVCFESDGTILFWSRACARFLGLPDTEQASIYTLGNIIQLWKDKLEPGAIRDTLSARMRHGSEQQGSLTLLSGEKLDYDLRVHEGNATIVTLHTAALMKRELPPTIVAAEAG
ncbi:MAG: PAS-domain containing protein [Lentibacter algarum]|uniref:PAS-domain containing protein n=1 Tax=Lentibacter algarum TaxID=576131 RepID=UPI003C738D49